MMRYYHFGVQLKKGKNEEDHICGKFDLIRADIAEEYAMIFLQKKELLMDGRRISPQDISRIYVITTNSKVDNWVTQAAATYDRIIYPFAPENIFATNDDLDGRRNITDEIIAACEKKLEHEQPTKLVAQIAPNENHAKNRKVFIVHGHDDDAIKDVKLLLHELDIKPIVLREQPDGSNTIIEKIEKYTDVTFAVVLYTPCDEGYPKEQKSQKRFRARQNVVFEHGYLMGKIGRSHVCPLVKGDVETPGDISGVVYTPMNSDGKWKHKVAQELEYAGFEIDRSQITM